jgi:hypothetical protein
VIRIVIATTTASAVAFINFEIGGGGGMGGWAFIVLRRFYFLSGRGLRSDHV